MKITEGMDALKARFAPCGRFGWRALCMAILLLALVLWQTVVVAGDQPTRPLAAPALSGEGGVVQLSMSPASKQVKPGEDFTVDIVVAAGEQQVNSIDVHLSFDTDYLQVTRASTSCGALPVVAKSLYDNDAGTIDFNGYKASSYVTGSFNLCTIYLHAVTETLQTLLTSRGDPLVVAPGGVELAASWTNGKIMIDESEATIPPVTDTPTITPTLTFTPTPTDTAIPTATATPSPIPTDEPGGVCVAVYHELNKNLVRETNEPLLADAHIQVSNIAGTPVATYETDGINEPYCFDLTPDEAFVVSVISPPGYMGYGPQSAYISSISGHRWNLDVAQVEIDYSTSTPTPTSTPTATPSPTPTAISESGTVEPGQGGRVQSPDGLVEVQVPGGAITDTVTMTISYVGPAFDPTYLGQDTPAVCLLGVGQSVLIEAEYADASPVVGFQEPITLTVCYAPGVVPDDQEEYVALYYWNADERRWVSTGGAQDDAYCIRASLDHVGLFSLGYPANCMQLPILYRQGAPEPEG
ncbi:MAG: hypothetical protein GX552_03115 [Chloroflexi bacterium]|jgi:hypothetical protein|nr:hypothetical protein [Chloroflexota bacterium]